MDKNFCRQIDNESLVEQYVAGKLRGNLLDKFEQHLKDCENHARAVLLEKALKRGVSEFARGEIKSKLRDRLKKREDTRFMILRYAAILLVAVVTPLLLYYQFNIAPQEMAESLSEEEKVITEDVMDIDQEELQEAEEPPKIELKPRKSTSPLSEDKVVHPAAGDVATEQQSEGSSIKTRDATPLKISDTKKTSSSKIQNMLKSVKAPPAPAIEADYPAEKENQAMGEQPAAAATQDYRQERESSSLNKVMDKKVEEDSLSIRECINNFLDSSERQTYEIQINIQVLKDGKIGELKLVKTTHQSDDLESCLFSIIKAWALPVETGEGMVLEKITY